MRAFKRVYELTEDEHRTLVQGTKSRSGFTMRRNHILLLSAEGLTPQQSARRLHCGEQTVRNVIRACLSVNPMTTGFFRIMTVWRFAHASKSYGCIMRTQTDVRANAFIEGGKRLVECLGRQCSIVIQRTDRRTSACCP